MPRTVNVAVVGAGGAAQVVHLPILKRLSEVNVAGLVDADVSKARTIAERFEVDFVASTLDELADRASFDAALICSPTSEHESGVLSALAHGAHVMCERPLVGDSASARRLIDAASEAGRELMVANNLRYRFDLRAIKHFVANGEAGEVHHIRSNWLNRRSRRPRRGWRRDPSRAGGGALMDLGAQALDVLLWILDYPVVERVCARLHGVGDVETSAVVHLAMAGGASASVEVTWELIDERDRHSVVVLGDRGSAYSYPLQLLTETESGVMDVTPPIDRPPAELYTDSYRQEWGDFLRHVRGEKPHGAQEDQVRLIEVLEACYQSAREGHEVIL
ncbi:MAG: Gfo/Idh/MocA family oxidoreductase [Gemmatimonadota bacterium]